MRVLAIAVVAILSIGAAACGGHPPIPPRGVVESNLGGWKFHRFQEVLDVEVWVDGNPAKAFTASYLAAAAEKRGHVDDKDVVNVFVTRYQKADGILRETVKLVRRLAAEQGYQVDERKIGGTRTLTINGHGEAWVMWPASRYVVKVGGRGRDDVPGDLVADYAKRYPSTLPGGALEGALPGGPEVKPKAQPAPYDPNNPQPDLEHYDPHKTKLPSHKD